MGKQVHDGKKLVSAQSLADDFNSDPINLYGIDQALIRIEASSVTDNTGTFKVQHRINNGNEQGSWDDLDLDTTPTLADAAATLSIYLSELPPGDIRVAFTAAGSTPDGSCDIWFCGRES